MVMNVMRKSHFLSFVTIFSIGAKPKDTTARESQILQDRSFLGHEQLRMPMGYIEEM